MLDDALVLQDAIHHIWKKTVSILVVLDDALVPPHVKPMFQKVLEVSILVVLDDALVRKWK